MDSIQEIKKHSWTKNWSGNWRATFSSLYQVYAVGLKKKIGKNLETNLLVCEKHSSSNYISKKALDDYCNFIAKLVIKNNHIASKWAQETIDTAEKLLDILKKIKTNQKFNLNSLLLLKKDFYLHIPPHFSMKKVVDYLHKDLQKKLTPKLTEARLKTENLFNEVDFVLRQFTKFIASKSDYPPELTEFLIIDEIENFFKKGKLPTKNELLIRTKGFGIFYKKSSYGLLIGKNYQELNKILIGSSKQELKGSAAYQGYTKGIARVVFDPAKVEEFNQGDILVTGMTRPEFLPLMKKASAFVTDAGGLLSHAAIVARELKKPCILATQVATKVLKDGDLIEVNANKGIVRKLS